MSQTTLIAALVGAIAIGTTPLSAPAQGHSDSALRGAAAGRDTVGCNDQTIKGTYAVHLQGTRPVQGAPGTTESAIGLLLVTFDGAGNFMSVANIKGSVSGFTPNRPGSGIYAVNHDCTATTTGFVEEALVIIDRGREIRSITVSPPPFMVTAVWQRIAR